MEKNYSDRPEKKEIDELMGLLGRQALDASKHLATVSAEKKNDALNFMAEILIEKSDFILQENKIDLNNGYNRGQTDALMDRLELNLSRIEAMAQGLSDIALLDDPVGEVMDSWEMPNGLKIERVRMPLGVIGIIYEARPNVTADAGALCLKSGNACILRGGSESYFSSKAILSCLHSGLSRAQLPNELIQMVETTDREAVGKMLTMTEYIDVIVPRGGESLTSRVMKESKIPTFQHLSGLCHTYIHKDADINKARRIVLNAKMRRTGICGATETLLVDKAIAYKALPNIIDDLIESGCEVRGDKVAQSIDSRVLKANETDWDTEYLDSVISVRTVSDLGQAIEHINEHSSEHTDAIVSEDSEAAELFMNNLSSSIVMHNASTQFADGGEFGMGAEIGIATGKMHARGPVGVKQLTTFKYKVRGDGTTRP